MVKTIMLNFEGMHLSSLKPSAFFSNDKTDAPL